MKRRYGVLLFVKNGANFIAVGYTEKEKKQNIEMWSKSVVIEVHAFFQEQQEM